MQTGQFFLLGDSSQLDTRLWIAFEIRTLLTRPIAVTLDFTFMISMRLVNA